MMRKIVEVKHAVTPSYWISWVEFSRQELKEIRARNLEARNSGTYAYVYGNK
jgi:desulfoferrodoxin (superoxide reductase-like protein)